MKSAEFAKHRKELAKTQRQMAQLLGTSVKAVQSFEQGWRPIPVHVERQLLFLVHLKTRQGKARRCWAMRKCPAQTREQCPAWELNAGHLCWFINGTICQGEIQGSWTEKMAHCRQCEVFHSAFV